MAREMSSSSSSSLRPFRILSSGISMISGTVLILHSLQILRSDQLQIDKYIGSIFRERSSSRYQIEVLASCFISIIFGIVQTVVSLIYFVNEIRLKDWIWLHFCCIIAYSICLISLDQPKQVLQTFTEFYMSLVANTFVSVIIVFIGLSFKVYVRFAL